MNKDQKVTLFRAILKLVFVFITVSFIFWSGWNLVFVEELGIGNKVEVERFWVFGFPTLLFFYSLRLLSPAWFVLLKVSDFIIYTMIILAWLALIWWLQGKSGHTTLILPSGWVQVVFFVSREILHSVVFKSGKRTPQTLTTLYT